MLKWPLRKYNLPVSQTQKNLEQEARVLTLWPLRHLASCGTKHMVGKAHSHGTQRPGRGIWFSEAECWNWRVFARSFTPTKEPERSMSAAGWGSWLEVDLPWRHYNSKFSWGNSWLLSQFCLQIWPLTLSQKKWVGSIIFKNWAWVSDVLRLLTKANINVLIISYHCLSISRIPETLLKTSLQSKSQNHLENIGV